MARKPDSDDVLATLTELFVKRGPPVHIRSDQGPEFVAAAAKAFPGRSGVTARRIEKASPGENGDKESFNGKLRDELLEAELFCTLAEAKVLIEAWRRHCNTERAHSTPVYRPPVPEMLGPPSWPGRRSAAEPDCELGAPRPDTGRAAGWRRGRRSGCPRPPPPQRRWRAPGSPARRGCRSDGGSRREWARAIALSQFRGSRAAASATFAAPSASARREGR
ncbi:MAG: transposase family protein [Alphaproteobacteria bacterium]|nr:transposase family protein [Alphaproteobacteria bacterium]